MTKKLVVSWDTYSWIHNMAGYIAKEPKGFEIIIVMKDDEAPIHWTKAFCQDAVYAQRCHDLYCVGRHLGINKLSNMMYNQSNLNIEALTAQFQMQILLSGIREVYFQHNTILEGIFRAIKKKVDLSLYAFDGYGYEKLNKVIHLSQDEVVAKRQLLKWMIALPHYRLDYDSEEYLYKV